MTRSQALAATLFAAFRAVAVEPLPAVGARVEQTLGPGVSSEFRVTLGKGEFLRVGVEQRGVDVVLSAFGPDGRRVVRVDRAGGQFGREPISIVARRSGEYRIRIEPFAGTTVPGLFAIRVEERRMARDGDRLRAAAEKQQESCVWPVDRRSGLDECRRAVALWEKLGDGFEEANALIQLGDFEAEGGRRPEALAAYNRALAAAVRAKEERFQAVALRSIGLQLTLSGEAARAADVLGDSIRLARSSAHPQVEAGSLELLGWSLWGRGDYEKALEAGERAATLAHERGDRVTEGWAIHLVGLTYATLGDLPRGLDLCRRAVELNRAAGERRGEALALSDAGWIYFRAGRLESAEQTLGAVVELQRAAQNRSGEALALVSLGHVIAALGRKEAAGIAYREALSLARAESTPAFEAHALSGLGRLAAASGDAAGARSFFDEELALRRRLEDPAGEGQAALALARLDAREGRLDVASERIEPVLARLEGLRARFHSPDIRVFASASSQPLYDFAVDVLMSRHEASPADGFDRRAFEMAERGRARALLEDLAEVKADPGTFRPLTLADVQGSLPPGTALVSFEADDARLLVFVVTRRSFRARRLSLDLAALSARLENVVDLLSMGDGSGSRRLARRLYADVVAPWRNELPREVTRLVIVPDGLLARLPFEALESPGDQGSRLVEEFEISYAPSATVLARLRERDSRPPEDRPDLLVVADPARGRAWASPIFEDEGFVPGPLPFASLEAGRVARFGGAGSVVLSGADASKAHFASLSPGRFRVLHFATHGLVSQRLPSSSALALAPSGTGPESEMLGVRDILGLKLANDLVVLSACQTARGRIFAGEGVQSLARAFLQAGARSVVASLWNINDEGAVGLMQSFYRNLSTGRSKAGALRAAKLASLGRGEPPVVWAAFVLLGEPDEPVRLGRETLWARFAGIFSR